MSLSVVQSPAVEPITLIEVRRQCKVPDSIISDDALLDGLIRAARERAEAVTARTLIETIFDKKFDEAPCYLIELPRPPLRSVVSISYIDSTGATQTWDSANYQVDAVSGPFARRGRVTVAPGVSWPTVQYDRFNAFTVRFKAGYGTTPAQVPNAIREAMLLMIGAWYVQREDSGLPLASIPLGAQALLTPYKVYGC